MDDLEDKVGIQKDVQDLVNGKLFSYEDVDSRSNDATVDSLLQPSKPKKVLNRSQRHTGSTAAELEMLS